MPLQETNPTTGTSRPVIEVAVRTPDARAQNDDAARSREDATEALQHLSRSDAESLIEEMLAKNTVGDCNVTITRTIRHETYGQPLKSKLQTAGIVLGTYVSLLAISYVFDKITGGGNAASATQ